MTHIRIRPHRARAALFVFTVLTLLAAARPALCLAGGLEDYVGKSDPRYSWKTISTTQTNGFTVAHLEMISQQWREHVWSHHLQIVVPDKVRNPDIAFVFVTGDGEGKSSIEMLKVLARRAGAVAAVVTKVPNQPLYGGRNEDALIAYTFDQYFKTGDATWPLLFPMVKSAVRAMDTVKEFGQKNGGQNIERFVVSGASKRGWTTWLAAAADPRVTAIAPMVIDMLNMKKQIEWAEQCYGKQSEQIRDYTDLNLHLKMDEPRIVSLRAMVDPYSYRNRYTLPKLLLLGTNDPYWTVDSLRHYWDDLPEPKLIFQTPNAGHNLGDRKDAIQTLAAFFQMIADRQPLPKMTWRFQNGADADLHVTVQPAARSFRLFTANSPDRDFRNDKWSSTTLPSNPGRMVDAHVEKPADGYRAFLVEAVLTTPSGEDYKLSTEARVVPDGFKP
jgi:PhoPQ-activated pathogenicity-related protein